MLDSEPPKPSLWKATLAAAILIFPIFYVLNVAITRRVPGLPYVLAASAASFLFALATYRKPGGIEGPFGMGSRVSNAAKSLLPRNHDGRDERSQR